MSATESPRLGRDARVKSVQVHLPPRHLAHRSPTPLVAAFSAGRRHESHQHGVRIEDDLAVPCWPLALTVSSHRDAASDGASAAANARICSASWHRAPTLV
jgi:hypothetical protein